MIQHISGGQKLNQMLGSFFEIPFYLRSSIPADLGGTEFQFCLLSPVRLMQTPGCASCWLSCCVLVVGKYPKGKEWRSWGVSLLCGLLAPNVLDVLVAPSMPSNSWVSLFFLILSHFYCCFQWEILFDIAIPSYLDQTPLPNPTLPFWPCTHQFCLLF